MLKMIFYQDRLGTNIGKVEKREAFSAEGRSWSPAKPLGGAKPFAWSVKPRLRVLSSGIVVLSGGRPVRT
jgi:hypothetical protein